MVVVLGVLAVLIFVAIHLPGVGMVFVLVVTKVRSLLGQFSMSAIIRYRTPRSLKRQQKHKEHEDE